MTGIVTMCTMSVSVAHHLPSAHVIIYLMQWTKILSTAINGLPKSSYDTTVLITNFNYATMQHMYQLRE